MSDRGPDCDRFRRARHHGRGRDHQAHHRISDIAHLPPRGEIELFDRSWHDRAGVEKVMGFFTLQEYSLSLREISFRPPSGWRRMERLVETVSIGGQTVCGPPAPPRTRQPKSKAADE